MAKIYLEKSKIDFNEWLEKHASYFDRRLNEVWKNLMEYDHPKLVKKFDKWKKQVS